MYDKEKRKINASMHIVKFYMHNFYVYIIYSYISMTICIKSSTLKYYDELLKYHLYNYVFNILYISCQLENYNLFTTNHP